MPRADIFIVTFSFSHNLLHILPVCCLSLANLDVHGASHQLQLSSLPFLLRSYIFSHLHMPCHRSAISCPEKLATCADHPQCLNCGGISCATAREKRCQIEAIYAHLRNSERLYEGIFRTCVPRICWRVLLSYWFDDRHFY